MVMIICPDCGKEQDNLNKFCRNCGADLSKVEPIVENNDASQDLTADNTADYPKESADNQINVPVLNEDGTNSNELTIPESSDLASEGKSQDVVDVSSLENTQAENIKRCSDCGTELDPNVKFCPNCGKSTEDLNKASSVKFCPSCGAKLKPNANFCPECGSNLSQPSVYPKTTTAVVGKKTPIVAVILSFLFPGLGQFYNGQGTKGIYFIVLAVVSWILFLLYIGMILYIIVWLWSIYDGFKSAEAINRGEILEDKLF